MNKKISICLILVLLCMILNGCEINHNNGVEEAVILTYSTMHLEEEMKLWITEWNQQNPNCRIEVKEYNKGDYETNLMQLNADIVSGKAPDIIDLSGLSIAAYISKGILADLYSFIDADSNVKREDFVPGILRIYERDNKLYGITLGYSLETLMGKKRIVGSAEQWNNEKVQSLISEMPQDNLFIDNLSPVGLLRVILQMGMEEYINREDMQNYLRHEKILQLLELADSMSGQAIDGDTKEYLADNRLLLYRAYISSVSDYQAAVNMFQGEDIECVGYPSEQGGITHVHLYLPIGISELSSNKEEAWQFVSSLLSEEFQGKHIHFNFPILETALHDEFEKALNPPVNSWSKENKENVPSQEDIDSLYEVINAVGSQFAFDRNIWLIIEEESQLYFSGSKSIDEVLEIIQKRIQVYLEESN